MLKLPQLRSCIIKKHTRNPGVGLWGTLMLLSSESGNYSHQFKAWLLVPTSTPALSCAWIPSKPSFKSLNGWQSQYSVHNYAMAACYRLRIATLNMVFGVVKLFTHLHTQLTLFIYFQSHFLASLIFNEGNCQTFQKEYLIYVRAVTF